MVGVLAGAGVVVSASRYGERIFPTLARVDPADAQSIAATAADGDVGALLYVFGVWCLAAITTPMIAMLLVRRSWGIAGFALTFFSFGLAATLSQISMPGWMTAVGFAGPVAVGLISAAALRRNVTEEIG